MRLLVALDEGYEAEVTDAVADQERDEGQPECYSTEVPLAENRAEALEESEDEGIGESGKKRKAEDNRLGREHDELRTKYERLSAFCFSWDSVHSRLTGRDII